ncbi:hypothetical protein ALC56_03183 [Trachymyrmex septentrionalis]|uniref:Uncharacterized protein n=1 Tax=Trachymyrmex septentrionalis TaxID=34720 RepID=A0A151JZV0_9HYME|nr:hypothetical protein ALC56_03183 [Trachymyrmex septentrionalis]
MYERRESPSFQATQPFSFCDIDLVVAGTAQGVYPPPSLPSLPPPSSLLPSHHHYRYYYTLDYYYSRSPSREREAIPKIFVFLDGEKPKAVENGRGSSMGWLIACEQARFFLRLSFLAFPPDVQDRCVYAAASNPIGLRLAPGARVCRVNAPRAVRRTGKRRQLFVLIIFPRGNAIKKRALPPKARTSVRRPAAPQAAIPPPLERPSEPSAEPSWLALMDDEGKERVIAERLSLSDSRVLSFGRVRKKEKGRGGRGGGGRRG